VVGNPEVVADGEVAEHLVEEILGLRLEAPAVERDGHPASRPEKPHRVLEAGQRIGQVGK